MAEFLTWDVAAWGHWVVDNPAMAALAALAALLFVAGAVLAMRRTVRRYRVGEFAGALPERHLGPGLEHGQVMPGRRAEVLAAIDQDYATGRIDRGEWERRRRELP